MASMHPRPSFPKHCTVKTNNDSLVTVTTIPGLGCVIHRLDTWTLSSEDWELHRVRDGDE